MSRIINYNIEQECNKYLKKKVLEHNSKYQSKVIPIPRFRSPAGPLNAGSVNFMGRVMNALMLMTSPDTTVFAPENVGWYNSDGTEVAGIKTFALLNSGLSVTGLAGLDRLLAFRIVHHLGAFLRFHKENVTGYLPLLEQIRDGLFPENSVPRHSSNLYSKSLKKLEKLMAPMLSLVLKIGQAQLLRRQMTFVLKFSCRLDANLLYQALTTVNTAVLNDVREHYRNPAKPYPKESNPLLGQLNKLLSASGMSDPFCKIYTVTEPVESLPALLLFFVITYMQKLQFDHQFSTLVRRKQSYPLDGMPFVVGVWTLLKQFHPSYTRQLLAYLGQFVRASVQHVQQQNDGKLTALPMEATNTLLFIDHFCKVLALRPQSRSRIAGLRPQSPQRPHPTLGRKDSAFSDLRVHSVVHFRPHPAGGRMSGVGRWGRAARRRPPPPGVYRTGVRVDAGCAQAMWRWDRKYLRSNSPPAPLPASRPCQARAGHASTLD